jgi:hypothetical protein
MCGCAIAKQGTAVNHTISSEQEGRKSMHSIQKITLLGLVMVVSVGFSMMNVDEAYAQHNPRYIGEHCWVADSGLLRLGLTHQGDGHVSFCGLATWPPYDWAMNGNLEVVGDEVLVTSTEAVTMDGGTFMIARVAEAVLDLTTLNGTARFMEMNWDGTVCNLDHYEMPLTYMPCDRDEASDFSHKREELVRFLRSISQENEE